MKTRWIVTGTLFVATSSIAASAQQVVSVLKLRLDPSSGAQTVTDHHYPGLAWQRTSMELETDQLRSLVPVARAVETPRIYMRVFRGGVRSLLERSVNAHFGECVVFSGARYPIELDGTTNYSIPVNTFLQQFISENLTEFVTDSRQLQYKLTVTIVFEQEPQNGKEETSVLKLAKEDLAAYFSNAIELDLAIGENLHGDWQRALNPPAPPPPGGVVTSVVAALVSVFAGQPAEAATVQRQNATQPPVSQPAPFVVPGPCDRLGHSVPLAPTPTYRLADADLVPAGTLVARQTCGE